MTAEEVLADSNAQVTAVCRSQRRAAKVKVMKLDRLVLLQVGGAQRQLYQQGRRHVVLLEVGHVRAESLRSGSEEVAEEVEGSAHIFKILTGKRRVMWSITIFDLRSRRNQHFFERHVERTVPGLNAGKSTQADESSVVLVEARTNCASSVGVVHLVRQARREDDVLQLGGMPKAVEVVLANDFLHCSFEFTAPCLKGMRQIRQLRFESVANSNSDRDHCEQ